MSLGQFSPTFLRHYAPSKSPEPLAVQLSHVPEELH